MGIVGGMGIAGSCLLQGIECMGLGSSCPSFAMQRVARHGIAFVERFAMIMKPAIGSQCVGVSREVRS